MTFTYSATVSTDTDKVRLLISDIDEDNYIFEDVEIQVFLDMEAGVLLTAARALEVIAANEALVSKRVTILDLETDGPAVAKELRATAAEWRKQANGSADDVGFAIAEMVLTTAQYEQAIINRLLREQDA